MEYLESQFSNNDLWKVYSGIIADMPVGGDATAANQLLEIDAINNGLVEDNIPYLSTIAGLLKETGGFSISEILAETEALMIKQGDSVFQNGAGTRSIYEELADIEEAVSNGGGSGVAAWAKSTYDKTAQIYENQFDSINVRSAFLNSGGSSYFIDLIALLETQGGQNINEWLEDLWTLTDSINTKTGNIKDKTDSIQARPQGQWLNTIEFSHATQTGVIGLFNTWCTTAGQGFARYMLGQPIFYYDATNVGTEYQCIVTYSQV